MDPQAFTGLAARIAHLSELIDADGPGRLDSARAELLDLVLDLLPATRWATLSHRAYRADGDLGAGPVSTVAVSGPVGGRLDELQYEVGEGPALLALSTGEVVTSDDLGTESRWPGFGARALAGTPARSVCSYPLGHTGRLHGTALNLYSDRRANFTGERAALVTLVAAATGLAVRAIVCREPADRS